jgi:hypothetical protein
MPNRQTKIIFNQSKMIECIIEVCCKICFEAIPELLCKDCCEKKGDQNTNNDQSKAKEETSFKVDLNVTSQPTYGMINQGMNYFESFYL